MSGRYFVLLCTAMLLACTDYNDTGDKVILKVAHNANEQHPFQIGYEKFS